MPVRLAVIVHGSSSLWDMVIQTPALVLKASLETFGVKTSAEYELIVTQLWPRRRILVFDRKDALVNFNTAHLPQDDQVILVHHSPSHARVEEAGHFPRAQINREVARCYNLHGWNERPPFVKNQTAANPPSYTNPRDTSLL